MDNAGNRTNCEENNGRSLTWAYDNLYKLKMEKVTTNGTPAYQTDYTYDEVGNRQSRTTSPANAIPQLPDQAFNGQYDPNDRLIATGYNYNQNGNTKIGPDGMIYTYDAENHLLTASKSGVTLVYTYDGDGTRVVKSVNGATTRYLTDNQNPTGYVQVLEEQDGNGTVKKLYAYGLDLISQTDTSVTSNATQYYGYDGMGSTRQLFDSTGAIIDAYDYDAFGITINQSGTTNNKYLFQGERYDVDLGQYYLRARYMQPSLGRFWTMDSYEGRQESPNTLNKYSFTSNNPVNYIDPSGMFEFAYSMASLQAYSFDNFLSDTLIRMGGFGTNKFTAEVRFN